MRKSRLLKVTVRTLVLKAALVVEPVGEEAGVARTELEVHVRREAERNEGALGLGP